MYKFMGVFWCYAIATISILVLNILANLLKLGFDALKDFKFGLGQALFWGLITWWLLNRNKKTGLIISYILILLAHFSFAAILVYTKQYFIATSICIQGIIFILIFHLAFHFMIKKKSNLLLKESE